jgi:hypothetical protein
MYTYLINFKAEAYRSAIAQALLQARKTGLSLFEHLTGEYDKGGKISKKRK